jgi:hypothetical protein
MPWPIFCLNGIGRPTAVARDWIFGLICCKSEPDVASTSEFDRVMPAAAPTKFVIAEALRHKSPDIVRSIVKSYGFALRTGQGTKDSEIWVKPDGPAFWIVRLDSQGHKTPFHHGARPHYHKNWVAIATELNTYLKKFLPSAMVYADDGQLLGPAEDCKNDRLAAAQHIKR